MRSRHCRPCCPQQHRHPPSSRRWGCAISSCVVVRVGLSLSCSAARAAASGDGIRSLRPRRLCGPHDRGDELSGRQIGELFCELGCEVRDLRRPKEVPSTLQPRVTGTDTSNLWRTACRSHQRSSCLALVHRRVSCCRRSACARQRRRTFRAASAISGWRFMPELPAERTMSVLSRTAGPGVVPARQLGT